MESLFQAAAQQLREQGVVPIEKYAFKEDHHREVLVQTLDGLVDAGLLEEKPTTTGGICYVVADDPIAATIVLRDAWKPDD